MFRLSSRNRQEFYYRPDRRRWWWQGRGDDDDFPMENLASVDEGRQVWRIAWWGDGWGVWAGRYPDLSTPPAYSTVNIPHHMHEAAGNWALGVVPPHPNKGITCSHGGDPDAVM
ncbi:hypothetical protein ACFOY2_11670 [Nonomuraea purpurea]|uniref:Uncharacterized protein n=1 Tax=Nonomuraea purpurea TaxID=1849276 RepID=A0ABV8G5L9_9ACTN